MATTATIGKSVIGDHTVGTDSLPTVAFGGRANTVATPTKTYTNERVTNTGSATTTATATSVETGAITVVGVADISVSETLTNVVDSLIDGSGDIDVDGTETYRNGNLSFVGEGDLAPESTTVQLYTTSGQTSSVGDGEIGIFQIGVDDNTIPTVGFAGTGETNAEITHVQTSNGTQFDGSASIDSDGTRVITVATTIDGSGTVDADGTQRVASTESLLAGSGDLSSDATIVITSDGTEMHGSSDFAPSALRVTRVFIVDGEFDTVYEVVGTVDRLQT